MFSYSRVGKVNLTCITHVVDAGFLRMKIWYVAVHVERVTCSDRHKDKLYPPLIRKSPADFLCKQKASDANTDQE